jgi:hypothetical protein
MSIELHYYAPRWIEFALKDITAFPAKPLFPMQALLLSISRTCIENQLVNIHPVLKSIGLFEQTPWAAYCAEQLKSEAEHRPSSEYPVYWMMITPWHHEIQLHKVQGYSIELSPSAYERWIALLHQCLPSPPWKILSIGRYALVGYALNAQEAIEQAKQPYYLERSSMWLNIKTELEMLLFSDSQQGKEWEGMNSVLEYGGGLLPPDNMPALPPYHTPTIWITDHPLWQLLAQYFDIPTSTHDDKKLLQDKTTRPTRVWLDFSTKDSQALDQALQHDLLAWCHGKIKRLVLYTELESTIPISLELSNERGWKRRFYQWQTRHLSAPQQKMIRDLFLQKIGLAKST